MPLDLQLKPSCSGCGSTSDLYGSNCKHMTLCLPCGKTMAKNLAKCYDCGAVVSRLIREYNVRASPSTDKNYFIGRFMSALPTFSRKKNAENKWSLHKEGLQNRQMTDTLREKFKNRPWSLEDETGQFQYHGVLEGSLSATYYLLMMQGKEFVAIPAGSWYNFNKVARYKQLTLEEAEEKIKNRKKTADGYERWMMKAANKGAALFGEFERPDDKEGVGVGIGGGGIGGGKGRRRFGGDEGGNASDRGEEDKEEEASRKNRLGLNKRGGDDDEEEGRGDDADMDDDDVEKGDDWEHEEIFTDDDEAVGNDPDEREDLAPEVPAPPEIKQDDDDDDEDNEEDEEGGLSKSGKELKKLLGRTSGLNDSDGEEEEDDDEEDEDASAPPVLSSRQKDLVKEEPSESTPTKATSFSSASASASASSSKGTPSSSKVSKGKRKLNGDDAKVSNSAPPKKVKTENDGKLVIKQESASPAKSIANPKVTPSSSKASTSSTGPVNEDEIKTVLLNNGSVTTQDLVARFKSRLRTKEDKAAFADTLKRMSRIQKVNGTNYVVLKDR